MRAIGRKWPLRNKAKILQLAASDVSGPDSIPSGLVRLRQRKEIKVHQGPAAYFPHDISVWQFNNNTIILLTKLTTSHILSASHALAIHLLDRPVPGS